MDVDTSQIEKIREMSGVAAYYFSNALQQAKNFDTLPRDNVKRSNLLILIGQTATERGDIEKYDLEELEQVMTDLNVKFKVKNWVRGTLVEPYEEEGNVNGLIYPVHHKKSEYAQMKVLIYLLLRTALDGSREATPELLELRDIVLTNLKNANSRQKGLNLSINEKRCSSCCRVRDLKEFSTNACRDCMSALGHECQTPTERKRRLKQSAYRRTVSIKLSQLENIQWQLLDDDTFVNYLCCFDGCTKAFDTAQATAQHYKTDHEDMKTWEEFEKSGGTITAYFCKDCNESFTRTATIYCHVDRKHEKADKTSYTLSEKNDFVVTKTEVAKSMK
ncbi:unnamed protein product [Didymodactylos carnosus]|uniref:C2H2-type domain-containing protein n=1 Tax=Didymodactylos carnosus TaxID=1234261 RepID=A0A813Z8W4_9BILA|nr:unnamed protein product [Didymodactylos carnosus]CAF0895547.1 unnamed protein product [Didymodactylos carnosus]CAF3612887.1 unnamed protein product [Didymodactylos carnosus]CAF3678888.1 unnamed protein product [Didymodactylos carnosus]